MDLSERQIMADARDKIHFIEKQKALEKTMARIAGVQAWFASTFLTVDNLVILVW